MEREFVQEHRDLLKALVTRTQRIALGLFVCTFLGYGLALWIWFAGHSWTALVLATLSYLFFRPFRTLSWGLARLPLRGDPATLPVLQVLDAALEHAKPAVVMAELEAHLQALDAEAPQA